MNNTLNIGIVGAGGFATFASNCFVKIDGIQVVAVTDVNTKAAETLATAMNAKCYKDFETFLKDENIHLVYIATPPYLHYRQSKAALLAGKHVICEKPAALHAIEAEELASLANEKNLLYVVNLMQRYNPLYEAVKRIVDEKLLGDFLHGYFENYASDEALTIDHWFWDETKSGGIFIEHGVHFFDMFAGWFGKGKLLNALQFQRPDVAKKIIDRVQATVMYEDGVVNFYHGFNQPKALDRQELKLQFEKGDITLYEWVPVKMKIHGLLKNEQLEQIKKLLKDCSVVIHNSGNLHATGRFKSISYNNLVTIEQGDISEKMNRYSEIVTAMIIDQWNWIKDKNHQRVITEKNAIESLQVAEEATMSAANFVHEI